MNGTSKLGRQVEGTASKENDQPGLSTKGSSPASPSWGITLLTSSGFPRDQDSINRPKEDN